MFDFNTAFWILNWRNSYRLRSKVWSMGKPTTKFVSVWSARARVFSSGDSGLHSFDPHSISSSQAINQTKVREVDNSTRMKQFAGNFIPPGWTNCRRRRSRDLAAFSSGKEPLAKLSSSTAASRADFASKSMRHFTCWTRVNWSQRRILSGDGTLYKYEWGRPENVCQRVTNRDGDYGWLQSTYSHVYYEREADYGVANYMKISLVGESNGPPLSVTIDVSKPNPITVSRRQSNLKVSCCANGWPRL